MEKVRVYVGEDARVTAADRTLAVVARNLALDAAAAQLFEALRTAELPAILLKGPVTARWLYASGELRAYSDIDVLVPPERIRSHEQVLRDLGFHKLRMDWFVGDGQAISWKRGDDVFVDVHTSLWGASVPGDRQWAIAQARADHMDLAGTQVPIPDLATKAFLVATHVAKDGSGKPKPMEDLQRALTRLSLEDWRLAAALAADLGGTDAFSWGLRLTERGGAVAEALGLPEVVDAEMILRNENSGRLSRWFFKDHKGLRPKLRLLVGAVAPTPFAMKVRYPVARRGRAGLVAAYLFRPFHLLWWGVTSLPYWMEARRRARRGAD